MPVIQAAMVESIVHPLAMLANPMRTTATRMNNTIRQPSAAQSSRFIPPSPLNAINRHTWER